MARAIISVAEASRAVAAPFPWWALTLAAPVSPFCREVLEMRYLWRRPLRLDNAKLRGFLGAEPHVSLNAAVAFTLESLGSLRPGWPLDGRMDAAAAVRR
jgi:nucleoside-diphosphate-sugar epimerase